LCDVIADQTMPGRRDELPKRPEDSDRFAGRLLNFAETPGVRVDAFSQILSGVKLHGAVYFTAEFSAPWGLTTSAPNAMAAKLAPGAEHLVLYHLVIEGGAVIEMTDGRLLELEAGDVVVFPNADSHHMSSGKGATKPFPNYGISAKIAARDLNPLRAGGGGKVSRFVCGYMTCDPYACRPLLGGLPPVFKVHLRSDQSGQWLENSVLHLVDEAASARIGSEAMLAKLSETLFIDTLRRYISSLPEHEMGWLAGTRDPIVGKSLGLLHNHLAHPWTIADLAVQVGISRSALVERFSRYLSEPPMAYLTRRRLELAARTLEGSSQGVAEIAASVGYESEAAFNRAFKREFGHPPGRYRSDRRGSAISTKSAVNSLRSSQHIRPSQ
jgi:AraC-like DNA-binding protein